MNDRMSERTNRVSLHRYIPGKRRVGSWRNLNLDYIFFVIYWTIHWVGWWTASHCVHSELNFMFMLYLSLFINVKLPNFLYKHYDNFRFRCSKTVFVPWLITKRVYVSCSLIEKLRDSCGKNFRDKNVIFYFI